MKPKLLCYRCPLSNYRRHQVLGRGVLPATILIVGEAPGDTEDLVGEAFVGKAGKLLNLAMGVAQRELELESIPPFYITNVCQCRPCDGIGLPFRIPTFEEAYACRPNLIRMYKLCRPKVTVLLGEVAKEYCMKLEPFKASFTMRHPSFINRRGGKDSPEYRKFVSQWVEVYREALKYEY